MVDYVTDMSKWEKWQRDYRYGLILIMPPDEVAGRINPLRAKYDPRTFSYCPAHITLSDPLGEPLTPERDAEVAGLLAGVEPFPLFFDKPQSSRQHAGVAYPIHPREPIDRLREVLHRASVFTRPPYYTRTIAPHMTLAEFVTIEKSFRIVEELGDSAPRGSFLCDRLTYIVPDIHMHFHPVKTYRLEGTNEPPIKDK